MSQLMRAAIYARVSTDDQARDGTSLDVQRERCNAFAVAKGWTIVGEYVDEGVSGTKDNRPALNRLMAECRSGQVDAIVFSKFDRFSRNRRHLENACAELDALKVALVSVSENVDGSTATGQAFRALLGVFANLERDMIVERMNSGLRAVAEANYWPGAAAPYGYKIEKDGPHSRLVIDDDEAQFLRTAISLVVDERLSTSQAAKRLAALGYKPRRATRWEGHNLRYTLLNASLSGTWTWSRQRGGRAPKQAPITLALPPIISSERHNELRRVLMQTTRQRRASTTYPLSREKLVAECGNHYQGTTRSGGPDRSYKCYGSLYTRDERCICPRLDADLAEAAVWNEIVSLLTDGGRMQSLAQAYVDSLKRQSDMTQRKQTSKALTERVAALENGLGRAYEDRYTASGDARTLASAIDSMERDLVQARTELHNALALETREGAYTGLTEIETLSHSATKRLKSMTLEEMDTVFDILNIKVFVTGWLSCSACHGRGKVSGGKGGARCPACRGTRRHPTLYVKGTVSSELTKHLDAHVDSNSEATPKRCPYCLH